MATTLIHRFVCNHEALCKAKYCFVLSAELGMKRNFSDDPKKEKKVDLYKTLGLKSSATHGEIKKAYYDLSLKYHPDRSDNCEESAVKFREVTEAYEVLGNYGLRKKYDKGIPVSSMKREIKTTVDHKAKFQEFFDSRSAKAKSDADTRWQTIDNLPKYKFSSRKQEAEELDREHNRNKSTTQYLLIIVLGIILIIKKGPWS